MIKVYRNLLSLEILVGNIVVHEKKVYLISILSCLMGNLTPKVGNLNQFFG